MYRRCLSTSVATMNIAASRQGLLTVWVASAATAGVLVAAGLLAAALPQHDREVVPSTPGAATLQLPNYPHLTHAWRIHHAQSKASAGHLRDPHRPVRP